MADLECRKRERKKRKRKDISSKVLVFKFSAQDFSNTRLRPKMTENERNINHSSYVYGAKFCD
uniref:Uncharacterized protein n=1 Tax=Onchocerca volvulus TaxID=6282 RepID=A0A8R1Y2U1_ONCVO